jgi:hypothetical protein
METQSIEIKSLSGTCDIKVSDKLREIIILSLGKNCSNKDPIELKPKEQGFDETAEIVFDRTETATPGAVGFGFDWSFGNLFKNKKDQIIFTIVMIVVAVTVVMSIIIFLYCYCNRTKAAVRVILNKIREK